MLGSKVPRARRALVYTKASASGSSTAPAVTGKKGRRPMVPTSRDGVSLSASFEEAPAMQQYSDARMTKLISTGGPMSISYQLYTEGNVATWKQASVATTATAGSF